MFTIQRKYVREFPQEGALYKHSLNADCVIAGDVPSRINLRTCTRGSYAFRRRAWNSPVRRKAFEMSTQNRKEIPELTYENE